MEKPCGPLPKRLFDDGTASYKKYANAIDSKERLTKRLEEYGLRWKDVPGDGNCQFYALSDQIYGDFNHAKEIRTRAADWLRKNSDKLVGGTPLRFFVYATTWEEFCNNAAKEGTWGDHLTLMAVANVYNVKILIVSSIADDNYITEISPDRKESAPPPKQVILSHFAEYHYGSVTEAM